MASINPPTPAAHAHVPELQQYIGAIRDVRVANLCNVAAAAWLAYDICITFQQEVSLVWRGFAMFTTCSYFVLILSKFTYNVSLRREWRKANQVPLFDLPTISPLIYSFLRDSAFYFFLVFAGNMMNLIFQLKFPGRPMLSIGTFWLAAIYAVSASRLCLNTRESLRHGPGEGDWDTIWFDDIELHERPSAAHASNRIREVLPLAPPRDCKSPMVTFAQGVSGRQLSLQRDTFESDRKREPQTPVSIETRQSEDDYGLIAVAPWIILERPERSP
ncbi:hypothetical protein C8T65DRAFT_737180 [Cerioporus squamosus]|nr:hypothetical protein C8T65DRAFT_737180 [Cerioporus squamosus]